MSLVSVPAADLALGVPVPWTLCDQDGNILVPEGAVLETQEQLDRLVASGPLRELTWNSAGEAAASSATPAIDAETDAALAADASNSQFTFQDMRLRVGDRLQLQPPPTVSVERYIVKLIGWVDNISVLVTAPMGANGLRIQLRENDTIVARIFAGQKAFGFSADVMRVCKIPFEYLHLSFPEKVQGSVIRKSPRVRTRIIASVGNVDAVAGDRASGLIMNLSADGALVRTRQSVAMKDQRLQLSFRVSLHKVDAYLTVEAVVRNAFVDEPKDGDSGMMFAYGVQFKDLAPNDSVILQSLIYHQMIEHPHTLT
ncbi:MAG TPA: flagellar brake protein [Rhodocyclaceae bacterium]